MADCDMNLVLGADHKPARHVAGYFDLRDIFRAAVINVGDEQQDQIVSGQTPFDSRRAPGEDQGQNAEREKNEESTREDHRLIRRTSYAQRGTSTAAPICSRIRN